MRPARSRCRAWRSPPVRFEDVHFAYDPDGGGPFCKA